MGTITDRSHFQPKRQPIFHYYTFFLQTVENLTPKNLGLGPSTIRGCPERTFRGKGVVSQKMMKAGRGV